MEGSRTIIIGRREGGKWKGCNGDRKVVDRHGIDTCEGVVGWLII